MYPEELVKPMRDELTSMGIKELHSAQDVDEVLGKKEGTTLMVINSVCGCAAGNARPGVKIALKHGTLPEQMVTVFAGQDDEATAQVRSYLAGYPPSSPSLALFKDGQLVHLIPRHQIEGRMPEQIASELTQIFNTYCK
jgi:putative YphP/YqiW family bacilliredoxin